MEVDDEIPVRWNAWTRVQPVQFEDEDVPRPRAVRLSSPSARLGDLVQVEENTRIVHGSICAVSYSVLHVRRVTANGATAAPEAGRGGASTPRPSGSFARRRRRV